MRPSVSISMSASASTSKRGSSGLGESKRPRREVETIDDKISAPKQGFFASCTMNRGVVRATRLRRSRFSFPPSCAERDHTTERDHLERGRMALVLILLHMRLHNESGPDALEHRKLLGQALG